MREQCKTYDSSMSLGRGLTRGWTFFRSFDSALNDGLGVALTSLLRGVWSVSPCGDSRYR